MKGIAGLLDGCGSFGMVPSRLLSLGSVVVAASPALSVAADVLQQQHCWLCVGLGQHIRHAKEPAHRMSPESAWHDAQCAAGHQLKLT